MQPLAPESAFRAWLRSLYRQPWVVYAKPPFGSPAHVLHYLARYTHRVAISNHRLVAVTDDTVSFRWKDYRHGSQMRTLTLDVDEFLRRFLLHVLPKRFVRIRYFGLLAPRCRTARSRDVSHASWPSRRHHPSPRRPSAHATRSWPCPRCGAPMRIVERLTARQLFLEALLADIVHDTLVSRARVLALRPQSRSYARAPEVCPHGRPRRPRHIAVATPPATSSTASIGPPIVTRARSDAGAPHDSTPIADRPRPPQTPAAWSKRLYRK